jgi:hypothetical protein
MMKSGKGLIPVVMFVLFVSVPVWGADITLELLMPSNHFGPGSLCYLDLEYVNTGPERNDTQVFVALTVGTGDYWFYPGWAQFPPNVDWMDMNIPAGMVDRVEILPRFNWPGGVGSFTGAVFLAAVVHGGNLVSNLAQYTFGWSDSGHPTPTPSSPTPTPSGPTPTPPPANLLQPGDLTYLGAFRLPGDDTPPLTFAYGGNAMTFNPDGNPGGSGETLPGSLFVMGHDRQAWGTLPDGNQVAEISIPAPVVAANPEDLPVAEFLQNFQDVLAGRFTDLEEIPRVGMEFYNHSLTGPLLHMAWGQHQPPDTPRPTHGWFSPDLANPDFQGEWYIGNQNFNSVNGYMFSIPMVWANAYSSGRPVATGRYRDGGWSGMGPALFAYRPWQTDGSPPANGTHLQETALLLYQDSYTSEDIVRCMTGYQHADEWEGGAWISTPSGRTAVLFSGTKGVGAKYWYGYIHPDGPEHPCVDHHVTDMITCRMADGSPCPPEDFGGCCEESLGECISLRGWWSAGFNARLIFYNPSQLAQVAGGVLQTWEPQPYAMLDIDPYLFMNPGDIDLESLGWGVQRRFRIGDMAYDAANGLLYVLELFADGPKPVVHVWELVD